MAGKKEIFAEQLALPSAPVIVVTTPTEVMPGPPVTVMVALYVPSAAVVVLTVTGPPLPHLNIREGVG